MDSVIPVVYQAGVLRPLTPLPDVHEHQRLEVLVVAVENGDKAASEAVQEEVWPDEPFPFDPEVPPEALAMLRALSDDELRQVRQYGAAYNDWEAARLTRDDLLRRIGWYEHNFKTGLATSDDLGNEAILIAVCGYTGIWGALGGERRIQERAGIIKLDDPDLIAWIAESDDLAFASG